MSFNFIKEFWFKAIVFTLALLILTTWALSPISHEDLIANQEINLEQLTESTERLISKNFIEIQNEINYLITELKTTNSENNLENIDSSVKALFALEQKESQLELSGDELRNLDLSYWSKEDLNKSINRVYKSNDGLFYTGYQIISSPSGDNYFGYLTLKDSKYYFAILSLHFASSWSNDLSLAGNSIYVINSVGELIYHPETQYIGTEFNQSEKIIDNFDADTNQLHLKTRDDLSFVMASTTKDIKVVVSQARWSTPYGMSFYGRFLLVFLCLGLLLYTLSEYLIKKSKTTFLNTEIIDSEFKNFESQEMLKDRKGLIAKIQRLENTLASQKEYVSPSEQKKLLHEIKSKSANLIGQIQLIQGQVKGDAVELTDTAHKKATEIYKQVFSFLNIEHDKHTLTDKSAELSGVPTVMVGDNRSLDYGTVETPSLNFKESDRIEITEEDIGSEDFHLLGELESMSFAERIEQKKQEISEINIDENISKQLSEQDYGKVKAFDLEEEFLSSQQNEVVKLSSDHSLNEQMSEIDRVIKKADKKVTQSKNELKKLIRKPRLEV